MQAVTVKEALSAKAKGRILKRSLSSPNVQHVSNSLLHLLSARLMIMITMITIIKCTLQLT